MNVAELETRWKSILYSGTSPFRSLRIAADCIPELFISVDARSFRFVILHVPDYVIVDCAAVTMQNLTLEWHKETRFIIIGLLDNRFCDLYNDLTLSLYHRIKDIASPELYTKEFVLHFHKWAAFFEDARAGQLTESEVKGLFGELTVLDWYLNNDPVLSPDQLLQGWQGPYDRAQDFNFPAYNLEVITKDDQEVIVRVSSEHQLHAEAGKDIQLAIVDVRTDANGQSLEWLIVKIKETLFSYRADIPHFIKTLSRAGLTSGNVKQYNNYRWSPLRIVWYDCNNDNFPRLTPATISAGVSQVRYCVSVNFIEPCIIQTLELTWN